jgi:hypothetical protein
MYCPHCGTRLEGSAPRCATCDLDLRPVAAALASGEQMASVGQAVLTAQQGRWQRQRHSLGLLLVLCSLLAGCLIPISLGLFGGASWLGALVTLVAGVAGVLLLLGAMLILAAEGQILTAPEQRGVLARPALPLREQEPGAASDMDRRAAAVRRQG